MSPLPRPAAAVLLCVLAVTAGCSSFGAAGTPSPSVTPAPVPTADPFPPGVSDRGLENRTALLVAHAESLAARNYTVTSRARVAYENGTTYRRVVVRRRIAANGTRLLSVTFEGEPTLYGANESSVVAVQQWTNDSVSLMRVTHANGSVSYDRSPGYREPAPGTGWVGTRYYRSEVSVDETSDAVVLSTDRRYRLFVAGEPRGEAHLEAVVRADGRIRSTTVRSPVRIGDRNATAVSRTTVARVGETPVGRPAWLRRAGAATRR